jgi:hypothetical protein
MEHDDEPVHLPSRACVSLLKKQKTNTTAKRTITINVTLFIFMELPIVNIGLK